MLDTYAFLSLQKTLQKERRQLISWRGTSILKAIIRVLWSFSPKSQTKRHRRWECYKNNNGQYFAVVLLWKLVFKNYFVFTFSQLTYFQSTYLYSKIMIEMCIHMYYGIVPKELPKQYTDLVSKGLKLLGIFI